MDWITISAAIIVAIFAIIAFFVARRAYRGTIDKRTVAILVFIATINILNDGVSLILKYGLKLLGALIL